MARVRAVGHTGILVFIVVLAVSQMSYRGISIYPPFHFSTTPGLLLKSYGAPQGQFDPSPNVEIAGEASPDRQRVEPTIAVDPRNLNILGAGAQDLRLVAANQHRWHGYYRSADGGTTWRPSLLPGFPGDTSPEGVSSPLHQYQATTDPVLVFDRAGSLYYAGIAFDITNTGSVTNSIAFVAKYVNDGADYSGVTMITGPLDADKEWIAVDNTGGPDDGNVYLAFDANLTSNSYFGTLLTRSTDGGRTFSTPFYTPSDQTGELPGVTVGANEDVYVSSDAFNPVKGFPLNYTQVSTVTGGGTTLLRNTRAVDPSTPLLTSPPGGSFRAFTIPQIAADGNGVYLAWDDLRLGNDSVFFTRSTDGGSSWTTPLRVSDTLSGQHFFPTIAVSAGIISLAWYDSRLNSGTTITSLDLFYAYSLDHGVSFSQNLRITGTSFNPELVQRSDAPNYHQPFIGDYIGIASSPKTAYAIWTDNRNACDVSDLTYGCVDQDVFTAPIGLPDFALSANPTSVSIIQGATGFVDVSLASVNGLSGDAYLTATTLSGGPPPTPSATTASLAAGGMVNVEIAFRSSTATRPGTYAVNVSATITPRANFLSLSLTITPAQSGGRPPAEGVAISPYLWLAAALSAAVLIGVLIAWLRRRQGEPAPPSMFQEPINPAGSVEILTDGQV